MIRVTPPQKIISFAENKSDLDKIAQFIKDDWAIVKLMPYGNYFIGVMEKMQHDNTINAQDQTVYIPPRKKIIFT
ncbi:MULTISPECIES: DUF2674 domain-containing protein [Rickettsieae]|uniref:DUF2674 domain-containing protein n=1 Tax=Rickettsieae TaxID=33988 RepID=UPI000B9A2A1D|nr:DUF2674 domain-containing protein [Rickettsia endosymbiont of Culicoides newsteadi]MDN3031054.1 DUF2674 domain-containing protein [Candidatus Tisiphia sp.]OZG31399.1 hypothetical protein RiCNE_12050 [Rickettsia endosymbiont of Culicoides newsteadi]